MTSSTLRVLHALLADPPREHYGLELSKKSGIAHSTMYGIIVRLDDWGWLANRFVHSADRTTPPRRYYRLTSTAQNAPEQRWPTPSDRSEQW
jgi:DNA-binding PadR family transcriptional regulator